LLFDLCQSVFSRIIPIIITRNKLNVGALAAHGLKLRAQKILVRVLLMTGC
jgi:hypothetical protein